MQSYLTFALELADKAGKIMLENFTYDIDTAWKPDETPLTIADTSINQVVIDEVKKAFPDHGVLGEEDSFGLNKEWLWVLDPIDGTAPYSQGIPTATFSLALTQHGQSKVAVVLDPFSSRKYSAIKGEGAFVNNRELKVNDQQELGPRVYIDLGGDYSFHEFNAAKIISGLAELEVKITKNNSVVFNTLPVATGQHAATVYTLGHPWDGAAVALLVTEAGGKVTDLNGNERMWDTEGEGFIASNGFVHQQILDVIEHTK